MKLRFLFSMMVCLAASSLYSADIPALEAKAKGPAASGRRPTLAAGAAVDETDVDAMREALASMRRLVEFKEVPHRNTHSPQDSP